MAKQATKERVLVDTRVPASTKENREWLKTRSKHVSGFCNENGKPGQHEGSKPVNHAGRPLPTCNLWTTCPCECHKRLDDTFASVGRDRFEMLNPDYKPVVDEFVMPEFVVESPVAAASVVGGESVPYVSVDAANPIPVMPAAPLAERRTETGRAARGGLEAQVWEAVDVILKQGDSLEITPKVVADMIAERYKIPTPSSGAVNAVWDRWEKLGFSEQAKKPNRFVRWCNQGTWEELAGLKSKAKREKKMKVSAQRRGLTR